MTSSPWLCLGLATAALGLGVAYFRNRAVLTALRSRFAPIVSADAEAKRIKEGATAEANLIRREADSARESAAKSLASAQADLASSRARWDQELGQLQARKFQLVAEYQRGKTVYDQMRSEISLLEENLENISFGVYRPHFTFETSDDYKVALERLWEEEKAMIRNGSAVVCRGAWEVSGSKKAGERMTKQYTKLMLRSFNAECDAAIAKVTWSNLATMSKRIEKSFDALNQLGTVMQMEILLPYRDLKLRELNLTHEQEEKKQQEREEARRLREERREEEKVQRELAAAMEEATREERTTEKALDKARKEAERLDEQGRALMAERIRQLEAQLAEAHAQKERAKAQAELTKCGHVYILSNTGSFGEEIVKIGMTRRLEPRERVAELGDASVPFPFDLHTLIYTENAPALETELHNHFWEHRINLANDRKEFFRVPITEVEEYLCKRGLKCTFNRIAEAKEYRQTCSDRERARAAIDKNGSSVSDSLPANLFG